MTVPDRTLARAATMVAVLASAAAYPFLPGRVPTHFDQDGRPDRYGSRLAAALGLPAVMAGLMALNDRFGSWPGKRDREDEGSGTRARDEAVELIVLGVLPVHLGLLARGAGLPVDMSRLQRGTMGALLVALGNVMPRLPRNGLIGFRTPWTLADPAVWERTHRVGGYLTAAAGLVSLASLPFAGRRANRLPVAVILASTILTTAYSLVAYARRAGSSR